MRLLIVFSMVLSLAACTFGVPIGGQQSKSYSTTKSKYGNPSSYVVMGKRYYVMDSAAGFTQRGIASWYGEPFHGRRTSSGETYNMHAMTAAHKTLPLPAHVRVKSLVNGKSIEVKVNDRGPFKDDRIIDLSYAAAKKLDMVGAGTAEVEIVVLNSPGDNKRSPVRAIPLNQPDQDAGIFVQLGSFGSEVNAINLKNELKQKNEKPIVISRFYTGKATYYRVRLGPLLDVDEAGSVQKRLQRKGYQSTRIVVGED